MKITIVNSYQTISVRHNKLYNISNEKRKIMIRLLKMYKSYKKFKENEKTENLIGYVKMSKI